MPNVPYSVEFVNRLLASHFRLTGQPLLQRMPAEPDEAIAGRLYSAPFAVVAHDDSPDPRFVYANLTAQRLFERDWEEFVGLASRLSAEAGEQAERARLLERVTAHGFIDDYSGVRIAKSGCRFRIQRATVWNVSDAGGRRIGQAAMFSSWEPAI